VLTATIVPTHGLERQLRSIAIAIAIAIVNRKVVVPLGDSAHMATDIRRPKGSLKK